MKHDDRNIKGIIATQPLLAGVIVAFVSLMSVVLVTGDDPLADMRIEPLSGVMHEGETLTVRIVVSAEVPVNVFKGELQFDHTKLRVESIDYNTSIADLWAEKPWYENGDGTINFIGGTTREGGFLGTGDLMTITFVSTGLGPAVMSIIEARILAHDGLGTDVPLTEPIDALFTVDENRLAGETIAQPAPSPSAIAVIREGAQTDLSGDGKQGIADLSIFMVGMVTGDTELDFSGDGKVNLSDLSILMSAQ
jgi:hypothetical protein